MCFLRLDILLSYLFYLFSSIDMEQDVQLTNDKHVVTRYADPKSVGKTADPGIVFLYLF